MNAYAPKKLHMQPEMPGCGVNQALESSTRQIFRKGLNVAAQPFSNW